MTSANWEEVRRHAAKRLTAFEESRRIEFLASAVELLEGAAREPWEELSSDPGFARLWLRVLGAYERAFDPEFDPLSTVPRQFEDYGSADGDQEEEEDHRAERVRAFDAMVANHSLQLKMRYLWPRIAVSSFAAIESLYRERPDDLRDILGRERLSDAMREKLKVWLKQGRADFRV